MKGNYRSEIELHNIDCMEFMKDCKDNQFDLAIIDPPYGIGQHKAAGKRNNGFQKYIHDKKKWDNYTPDIKYFNELFRISKNQIIWGANYFCDKLPISSNWIVWNKLQPSGVTFSMHELAYCSIKMQSRIFVNRIEKNCATNKTDARKYERIHPTQKPVQLYKWLLHNYAKEGDKILDTHLGSGSIAIACDELGFDLTACEIDKEYFDASIKRLEPFRRQKQIF
jgi:site-specific DNA-methyltransferase (adenine-specific)